MLDKLSADARDAVEPFLNRFETFKKKVEDRAQEVEAESEAGIDELIEVNPLDPNAMSTAFSAIKTRFDGLGTKVDQAIEKLEEEWEEATGDLDLEDEEQSILIRLWSSILRQSREFQHKLEQWYDKVDMKKNADWARVLYRMAEQECKQPRTCPACGASVEVTIQHAASAVNCPYCDSVDELEMGPATGLYYQGLGVHSLAHEAAFNAWAAMSDAEETFNAYRYPTDDDRKAHTDAVIAYWRAYYEKTRKIHPGFSQTVEDAVAGRMTHHDHYDTEEERKTRAIFGEVVRLARARDHGKLKAQMKKAEDVEECAPAILEHGDREGAVLALQIQFELEGEDEDREDWVREKLAELEEDLADR